MRATPLWEGHLGATPELDIASGEFDHVIWSVQPCSPATLQPCCPAALLPAIMHHCIMPFTAHPLHLRYITCRFSYKHHFGVGVQFSRVIRVWMGFQKSVPVASKVTRIPWLIQVLTGMA